MKNLLLTGAMLTLAVAAIAGPPAKTPTTIKCAVLKNSTVNIKDATAKKMYADYKGNRYFFCCGGCPAQFKADPAKFAKAPHIKTPKGA
jgi:YHS domain-containing protein